MGDSAAFGAQLEAVIDIVEIHRKPHLVHSSHLEVIASPCDQACRCHSAALMRNAKQIAVADVAIDAVGEGMRRGKTGAEDNTAVLHNPARPDELRTDRPNVVSCNSTQHLLEPLVIEGFDVVIEEAKDLAMGDFGSTIVEAWKVEIARYAQHPDNAAFDLGKVIQRVRIWQSLSTTKISARVR